MKIDLVLIILVIVIVYVFALYKDETMADIGTNELKLGSWTIKESTNGHLIFLRDGTNYNNNYNQIPQDTGFVALSKDGNIWSNRSTGRGWLADNKLNVSDGNVGSLNVNGKIALNNNPLMIRGMDDNTPTIKYES